LGRRILRGMPWKMMPSNAIAAVASSGVRN
jgi:hypothetical protein